MQAPYRVFDNRMNGQAVRLTAKGHGTGGMEDE